MKPRGVTALAFLVLLMLAEPAAAGVMEMPVDSETELYVMNGRLGSRHFFAIDFGKGRAHLGAMGFDPAIFCPGELSHERRVGLEVLLNNRPLYSKGPDKALDKRSFRLEFTRSCTSGRGPSGLIVTHCVVSPFELPRSLQAKDAVKTASAPFLYHTFTVENPTAKSKAAELVFALGLRGMKSRVLEDGILAFELPPQITNRFSWKPPRHALATWGQGPWFISGKRNGFVFNIDVPPGEKMTRTVVQASYTDGPVMMNVREKELYYFYYTRFFHDVEQVIRYALFNKEEILAGTRSTESKLTDPELAPERRWLQALTFHTYLCNTWLVETTERSPRFYVWEGDYAMLSTVDVAHEVEVLAYFMPWTLKLQLEQWARNTDETRWGPYIRHDLGRNQLTGFAYYENPFYGFFKLPPMPVEENANFALLLHWYDHICDDAETVQGLLPVMETMLVANMARDENGNGIADHDTGTTYDASEAIHVSPDNIYLGTKQMISYLVGAGLLERYDRKDKAAVLRSDAAKILDTLKKAHSRHGYLPVSLDRDFQGWDQRSLVLGDALLYPALTGFGTPEIDELAGMLRADFPKALESCRRPWGTVLTGGEDVTFFSKVMVMGPVAERFYNMETQLWKGPYRWNLNNDKAYNDGAYNADRDWTGYKYPRGVISMWPLIRPRPAYSGE